MARGPYGRMAVWPHGPSGPDSPVAVWARGGVGVWPLVCILWPPGPCCGPVAVWASGPICGPTASGPTRTCIIWPLWPHGRMHTQPRQPPDAWGHVGGTRVRWRSGGASVSIGPLGVWEDVAVWVPPHRPRQRGPVRRVPHVWCVVWCRCVCVCVEWSGVGMEGVFSLHPTQRCTTPSSHVVWVWKGWPLTPRHDGPGQPWSTACVA